MRTEEEDGMGFAGLASTADERREESRVKNLQESLAAVMARAIELRAENERLRAALKDCAFVAQHGTPAGSNDFCAVTDWIGRRANGALEQKGPPE